MRWVVESDPLGTLIPFWEHIMNLNAFGCTLDYSINWDMPLFENLFPLLFGYIWKSKFHPINKYFRNWDELFRFLATNLLVERTCDIIMKIWKLVSILTSYLTNWHLFFVIIFITIFFSSFHEVLIPLFFIWINTAFCNLMITLLVQSLSLGVVIIFRFNKA